MNEKGTSAGIGNANKGLGQTPNIPAQERMSRVDTAWLRMDNSGNLMMIVGVWKLSRPLAEADLRERVDQTLLHYPRFLQKVEQDPIGALWVRDAAFDLDAHIVVENLRRQKGRSPREALQARVGELASQALDPRRPLWQMHLIEDYEGGSALITRIHHCIADGIALISVMLSMADGGIAPPQRALRHDGDAEDRDMFTDYFTRPVADLTVKAIGLWGEGAARAVDWMANPTQPMQDSLGALRSGAQVMQDMSALALMSDDSPTLLKGRPIGRKRVAWSEPIDLDTVKAVGKALHGSVNDVLLSCVAGALGAYVRERGQSPDGLEIRAMVPVNLRPLQDAWKLGNRFGLAPLVLPIGVSNPLARLQAVRARMHALKGSYQPLLAFGVLAVAGWLVKPVQDALLNLFARKATAVMTNVPGPRQPLTFCGATVEQTLFWVPASGDISVGVSILSYNGGVQFGVVTDEAVCPDPQAIIDRFPEEFEKLTWLTMLLPWAPRPGARPPHAP